MITGYCPTDTAYGEILSSFRHLLLQHVILLQKIVMANRFRSLVTHFFLPVTEL